MIKISVLITFNLAVSFFFFLLFNSPLFIAGGSPSKTQTGLIPISMSCKVRLKRPIKCPVLLPSLSVSSLNVNEDVELFYVNPCIFIKKLYISIDASQAIIRPENISRSHRRIEFWAFSAIKLINFLIPILL